MKNKNNFSNVLKGLFLFAILAGSQSCQAVRVKAGAEKVRIFDTEPTGCLFRGEVSTIQDNEKVAYNGGEVEMSLDTRNELRNKAFDLDANVLVFTSKSKTKVAGAAPEKKDEATKASDKAPTPAPPAADKTAGQDKPVESVFLATAFRCPPLIYNR